MRIRLHHARILPMDGNFEIIEGEVWIQDERITYVGPEQESDQNWDRQIDLKGNLILPGFKNGHAHSAMTFLRSLADDKPLASWLGEQVFPMEAKLNEDDVYHLSKLAYLEYLTSGITANLDMYFYPDSIAQASIDCGMRTVIMSALSDYNQSIDYVENCHLKFNEQKFHPLISYEMGFHAEYTASKSLLQDLSVLAHQYKRPINTHISESKQEVDSCIERNGMTPGVYLDQLGLFDNGGVGFHGVHLTSEEIEIFKAKQVSVILNCSSNLKLSSGIPPILSFIEGGINLGIGTDGPASNNALDMFREMFLVAGLGKVVSGAEYVDANQVLKMATQGGAKAMHLDDAMSIKAGQLADLTVIDLNKPNMQPINNISKNLVYSGSKDNVKLTMINGRILYEDGIFFVGEELERIYEKANQIINRIRSEV